MNYSVYDEKPQDFRVEGEAAGCYLLCQDRLLLLRRHHDRPQGNTWGVPAGKLEKGETPEEAVIREIQEEVGLDIAQNLVAIGKLYIKLPHIAYIYHLFSKKYESVPEISLALSENVEARWVTLDEAHKLPLITGGKEALEYWRKRQ